MQHNTNTRRFRTYAHYLAYVRKQKKLSQADVVRASALPGRPETGISIPVISKVEAGLVAEPRLRTVIKLARGYGVPIDDIVSFFDERPYARPPAAR